MTVPPRERGLALNRRKNAEFIREFIILIRKKNYAKSLDPIMLNRPVKGRYCVLRNDTQTMPITLKPNGPGVVALVLFEFYYFAQLGFG